MWLLMQFQWFPLSTSKRFGTFSKKSTFGLWCLMILSISKNSLPVSSKRPLFYPAILYDWQGNPPVRMSKPGISEASMLFMSPIRGSLFPKLAKYVSWASRSISEAITHLAPKDSRAYLNPPMPAKSSINLISPLCEGKDSIF